MKKEIVRIVVFAVMSGTLFAQESFTVDLSNMKGSPVAMIAEPITNRFVLYPAHNAIAASNGTDYSKLMVLATNGVCEVSTNYPTDTVEYLIEHGTLTNMVKRLAAEGHVCSVLGHVWKEIPHVTLEYRPDGDYPWHRKCALCGKRETKEPGVWK